MSMPLTHANTSRTLQTPQGKLHYHEAGEGPPLLLLHGSGPGVSGWANFKENLAVFARDFRTLILDLPGYGGSDPASGHPVAATLAAATAFLDSLAIERVDLLGNSFGGMIGSHLAAQQPHRVRRLCTIGGMGANLFSAFPGEGVNLLVDFTEAPTREKLTAWLHSMVFDPSLVTEELIEDRWQRATAPATLAWSRQLYSREAIRALSTPQPNTPPSWAHLPAIEAPTLVTWGRDDRVSPLDMALLPMRLIPKCELHVFYNCGHWAMIERKAEFESTVLAFFNRD